MEKVIIAEGKTTNEAIQNGLKQLKTTKDNVNIKIIEEEKRMFFSILEPRVVKVEMTLKEPEQQQTKPKREIKKITQEEQEQAKQNIKPLLEKLTPNDYKLDSTEEGLTVEINNEKLGYLIGYRGETLYALQDILSSIASKGSTSRIRVILDIENYRSKRQKTLENLAERMAKTVIRTRREVKLEPMKPYERKIIHSKLQENSKVQTKSIGEDPHRRIIISLKNK